MARIFIMESGLSTNPVLGRLILLGGFLGAGKTTLISKFSQWLEKQGFDVGIVTNDQAGALVDTRAVSGGAASVDEVTGGCFCCRLDDLVQVISRRVERRQERGDRPLVILAEPVGSCTDLVATVVLPIRDIYRLPLQVSPFSVVLDARRALVALGGRKPKRDFSKDVTYIFRKQMEEAQILVINKADLLSDEELADVTARAAKDYPEKKALVVSARTGEGCEELFRTLSELGSDFQIPAHPLREIDYERYGRGEALLGWLNAHIEIVNAQPFDADELLLSLARVVTGKLREACAEVAPFKMALGAEGKHARLHQAMSDDEPLLVERADCRISTAEIIINLRAECDPELLEEIISTSLRDVMGERPYGFVEKSAFKPGQPVPTHRVPAGV